MRYGCSLLLMMAVFAVARYAQWIGLAIAIAVLLVLLWKSIGWLDRRLDVRAAKRGARAAELAAIAARADEQNKLVLAGDERGFYGEYAPREID